MHACMENLCISYVDFSHARDDSVSPPPPKMPSLQDLKRGASVPPRQSKKRRSKSIIIFEVLLHAICVEAHLSLREKESLMILRERKVMVFFCSWHDIAIDFFPNP